jgi:hypothetical protein
MAWCSVKEQGQIYLIHTRTGEIGNAYKILIENLKGRHHSEDLDVDGKRTFE